MSSSWHKPTLICVGAAVAVAAAIKVWKQRRALEAEPTPLELMALRNSLMHSEASMKAGREFKPRPSDIFIVTYPKCGKISPWCPTVLFPFFKLSSGNGHLRSV
jgi:hypothetical protein